MWFTRITFEPWLGGAYRALWEEPSMFTGVITAFEPPRLLRFGGPHPGADAHWQFELEPADGGTRMVFVQRIPPGHDVLARWPLDPPDGILLGAGEAAYAAGSVPLRRDDVLLLYSDGLVERRDRSLDDGLATLATTAAGIGDPEQLIAAVLYALSTTDSEDDTCLVALQVL